MSETMPRRPGAAMRARPRSPGRQITYVVFDLHDPAVFRRIAMLEKGGASVRLAGFRRRADPPAGSIDLGLTHARQMVHRMLAVLRTLLYVILGRVDLGRPDALLCRNLECLAVGVVYRILWSRRSRLAYEVLDIHRSMVGTGLASPALRLVERTLARSSACVITSSPGFVRDYFERINPLGRPLKIVENKAFFAGEPPEIRPVARPVGTGWCVGWFGGLRCGRSFEVLTAAAARMGGTLRLVLAGRAAPTELPNFDARAASAPFLDVRGPYRNPDDLPSLYGAVDFVWTIDFHEAETNSKWLLPNRLYEGGLHGAVPIARRGTETAEWVARHGIGLTLGEVDPESVDALLRSMTPERYRELQQAVARLPRSTWVTTEEDCADLVNTILGPPSGSSQVRPSLVPGRPA